MAATTVWGLDIGNSAIKAVKMTRSGGDCSIVDFDIIDIPGGDDPAERSMRLQEAMKGLVETHKFGNDPVFLGVPGSVCLHREFSLPPGTDNKLSELVQFEARQQIPFPLDQVEWGYERYQSDDSNAVNVTLIAVRKTDIQELLTLSENFNLKLAGIAAVPMALFNFINYEFKPDQTTLILDSGSKGTDFVVMNKRQIYFRNIQIAGRELTRVLENKFKVPFEKAENIKKNIAQSPQMDQILSVIEPTLRNLGADIQRTIGFYKSRSKGQKIGQCYLLGHTFRLPKMAEFLVTQIREAPFAIVEGLQKIRLAPSVPRDVWEHEFPTMAVAIGLGLQGLGVSELTLNLIPQEKEGEHARSAWKRWAALSAAVLLLALAASFWLARKAEKDYNIAREAGEQQLALVKKNNASEATASAPIPDRLTLVKRLSRLGRERGKIEQIYNALLNLRSADGKPFFGQSTHMYAIGLYVSRAPFVTELKSEKFRDQVDRSEAFKRLYAPLALGPDPLESAPELRADAPLMVVLSGESQIVDGQKTPAVENIRNLEDVLKNLKENKTHEVEHSYNPEDVHVIEEDVTYYGTGGLKVDVPLEGSSQPVKVIEPKVVKYSAIPFNMMFLWEDPDDKDNTPVASPAVVPIPPVKP